MNCPACDAGIPVTRRVMVPIVPSVQVRFPRSKKKRIRNKWAKQPKNWRFGDITWLTMSVPQQPPFHHVAALRLTR